MSYLLAIAEALIRLKDKKKVLDDAYNEQLAGLEQELQDIRSKCPHPKWEHQSDPSGGHDSFDVCELCGAVEYE